MMWYTIGNGIRLHVISLLPSCDWIIQYIILTTVTWDWASVMLKCDWHYIHTCMWTVCMTLSVHCYTSAALVGLHITAGFISPHVCFPSPVGSSPLCHTSADSGNHHLWHLAWLLLHCLIQWHCHNWSHLHHCHCSWGRGYRQWSWAVIAARGGHCRWLQWHRLTTLTQYLLLQHARGGRLAGCCQ